MLEGFLIQMHRSGVAVADADVVVQDVDALVGRHRRLGEGVAVGLGGDVGFEGLAVSALVADGYCRLLGRRQLTIDQHDLGPLASEENGRGAAVADRVAGSLAGSDDDGDLALEPHEPSSAPSLPPPSVPSPKPGIPSSSCTPSVFKAIDTRLYWPTVKTRSSICAVE